VDGPTTKEAQCCVAELRAEGTASSPQDAEQRFLQVAKPEVGQKIPQEGWGNP